MKLSDFLLFLIEDVMEEARMKHLQHPDIVSYYATKTALRECSTALMTDTADRSIAALLRRAQEDTAFAADSTAEWYWLCREAVVEWIAEVFSVILLHRRAETIVPPGRNAAIAAARILGVVPVEPNA
ncbi:hypothetical protein ACFQX4_27775 [Roseomonas sp. GCM10028921]